MSVPAEEEEEVVFLGKVEAEDEEQSLTEQLEQQQAQLDAINEQLAVDPSSEDLQQLKGSLDELVGLLQGELLRVKKAKLLLVVEAQFGSSSSSSSSNQPQQNNVESKESSSESSSSSSSSSEEESTSLSAIIEQFNGQECSVPFGTSDQYHDAILKAEFEEAVEGLENLQTPESLLFNAFFLYPLTPSMLTCPFYLKGSCRFTSSSKKTCKYSHGHRVTVQQIRPKSVYSIGDEVNYQKDSDNRKLFGLVRNSALPASSSSGEGSKDNHHHHHLWTRCEIVKTDPGTGRVLVKLVRDCTDFWVPMEMLVLVDQQFEKEEEEEVEVPAMMSSQTESSSTNSATPSSSFGEWERYTSGIGSKLLLKMGYTSGTGLGSRAQGILHPIESYVFPPGHSLDACFTLKAESERKKLDIEEVMKEKKKERRLEAKRAKQYEKAVEKSREKVENNSVFRLLDDMFHSGSSSASASTSSSFTSGSSKKQKGKSEPSRNQTKNLDAKSLALSAFKVDEELKKAEAELRRYEESFRRNSKGTPNGKSAEVQGDLGLKTIQQKRDRARAVVDGLRRRQAELGRETTLRKDKQKMIF